jgi:hypothetical protein
MRACPAPTRVWDSHADGCVALACGGCVGLAWRLVELGECARALWTWILRDLTCARALALPLPPPHSMLELALDHDTAERLRHLAKAHAAPQPAGSQDHAVPYAVNGPANVCFDHATTARHTAHHTPLAARHKPQANKPHTTQRLAHHRPCPSQTTPRTTRHAAAAQPVPAHHPWILLTCYNGPG